MRGLVNPQADMLALISPEAVVPADHPVRRIKRLLDEVLRDLSPLFAEMYAQDGRPSIPPERLLKAKFLQALYTEMAPQIKAELEKYSDPKYIVVPGAS